MSSAPIVLAVVLASAPALPAAAGEGAEASPELSPLETFQRHEDRLFRVGFRLATSNAPFCESTVPTAGLLIHDALSYARPDSVRTTFGLSGDIGIQSVAPESPAAAVGLLRNDTVLAIDGNSVASTWAPTDPPWKRAVDIRNAIDAALSRGPLTVTFARPGDAPRTASIEPVDACATRFELLDSTDSAKADGDRVLIGERFPGLAYGDDAFAAAVAHELAHNLLRHARTFAKTGWKRKWVRISERDADRLMPWLLYNAGYDPAAAVAFMREWGPRHGGGLLRKRTHDGWDERVEMIAAELPLVTASAEKGGRGKADWSTDFRPMLRIEE